MNKFNDKIIGTRDENGVTSLQRNGIGLLCAFKTPVVIQLPPAPRDKFAITPEQQQPPQIIQPPCTSLCPLFHIIKIPSDTNVTVYKKRILLRCSIELDQIEIEAEKEEDIKPTNIHY